MNLKIILLIISALFFLRANLIAQPEFDIDPDDIEIENVFNRFEKTFLINDGDQELFIDSIKYNERFYFISFDQPEIFPLSILPGDSVKMEIILSNYFNITSADTSDTMFFYYGNGTLIEDLEIDIKFFDDDDKEGQLTGTVINDSSSTEFTKIYLYREGIYLYDSLRTDAAGNFSLFLHEGNYTLAVEKEGFYFTYYNNTLDPYYSKTIVIDDDSITNITVPIKRKISTTNSVSGQVLDFNNGFPVDRGVIIVRKGKHDPTKMPVNLLEINEEYSSYAATINSDGTYFINDILLPGYYYIQAFPDFYIPSYNSAINQPAAYWQNADSVFIENNVVDKNVYALRDSAYGAGQINGVVLKNSQPLSSGDVIVYAQNIDNNNYYNYSISDSTGNFGVTNLPFGNYILYAQTLGSDVIQSTSTFSITPLDTVILNVELNFLITSIGEDELIIDSPQLYNNYPNPFNPATNIKFFNPSRGQIKLEILNILGETIQTLYEGEAGQGLFTYRFDAANLSSGVYLVRLETEKYIETKKAVLVK